jgi:hypothetical protein
MIQIKYKQIKKYLDKGYNINESILKLKNNKRRNKNGNDVFSSYKKES